MFRLIKLCAYALLGYVMYELYRGMVEGQQRRRYRGPAASEELEEALNRDDAGRMGVMSGPARGTTISMQEASGAAGERVVGRGVIHD